jgi:hypothetical protein
MATEGPLGAFELGDSIPKGRTGDFYTWVARGWVREDGLLASDTALAMPAGLPRDTVAREIIAFAVETDDLEEAQSWIDQIGDQAIRSKAGQVIADARAKAQP